MSQTDRQTAERNFSVRPYSPADDEAFLSLYECVWRTEKGREWFDWRFAEAPYERGIEMVVAEADGRLVGAEPLVPYRIRAGDRVIEAYQPVDWIVHPDYRRRGIFGGMTEHLLDRVADGAPLLFNFPNEQLLPGIRSYGWHEVDTVAVRYRIQDAGALAEMGKSSRARSASAALASAGSPFVRTGLGVLDRLRSPSAELEVDRVDGVPVETVREIYTANRPGRLHVPRDRAFLEWRFANPRWETTTYVARSDGEPAASVVTAAESIGGTRVVRLLDIQPTTDALGDPEAVESIVDAAVTDHADASVIVAPTGSYPRVLRRYGFVRDDAFPLSQVATTTYHAIRPLSNAGAGGDGDGVTILDGGDSGTYDLTDPDDWLLTLGDLDLA